MRIWELLLFGCLVYTRMESWNPVQCTRNHPVANIARRGNQASRTIYTWDGITGNELWQIHRLIWAVVASFWLLTFLCGLFTTQWYSYREVYLYIFTYTHWDCIIHYCIMRHAPLFGCFVSNLLPLRPFFCWWFYNGPTADVPSQIILPKTNSKSPWKWAQLVPKGNFIPTIH